MGSAVGMARVAEMAKDRIIKMSMAKKLPEQKEDGCSCRLEQSGRVAPEELSALPLSYNAVLKFLFAAVGSPSCLARLCAFIRQNNTQTLWILGPF